MPPVLFFALLLMLGVSLGLLALAFLAGADAPRFLALFALGGKGLLRLGAHARRLQFTLNRALHALRVDAPLALAIGTNRRTESKAPPILQQKGVHLIIPRLRAKHPLAGLIPAFRFPFVNADPKRIVEKNGHTALNLTHGPFLL